MKYHPYSSYSRPEVEWLDALPSHWHVCRTKTMLSLQKSKVGAAASEYVLLSLTLRGVIPRDISEGGKFPAEFDTYQIVEPEDLVFCLFDIDETPRTIGIAHDAGMITGAYNVYRANRRCVPAYACYYFLHLDSFKGLRPFYTGLRKVVRADTFSKVEMPAPPRDEQTQIAKFLDYETAKIDALIEKQQQLIELLQEKRQAVISHAVTKGLNPDAPMRDSGIEWLGEVPAHWEISKFGYISSVVRGGSPRPAGDPTLFNGDYSPWVTVAEITKDDEVNLTETSTFLTKKGSIQCRVFKSGTLLLSNSGATLGVPKVLMIDANANDGVVGFENLTLHREYCYYYLSSVTENLRERMKQGSGQPNLNTEIVKALAVPIPSTNEIELIVQHIASQREKFKTLAEKAQMGIELLEERRTALISAAVTGKIDVRGWKPPESENQTEVA